MFPCLSHLHRTHLWLSWWWKKDGHWRHSLVKKKTVIHSSLALWFRNTEAAGYFLITLYSSPYMCVGVANHNTVFTCWRSIYCILKVTLKVLLFLFTQSLLWRIGLHCICIALPMVKLHTYSPSIILWLISGESIKATPCFASGSLDRSVDSFLE